MKPEPIHRRRRKVTTKKMNKTKKKIQVKAKWASHRQAVQAVEAEEQ